MSPLVFSLAPRSQEWYGLAKEESHACSPGDSLVFGELQAIVSSDGLHEVILLETFEDAVCKSIVVGGDSDTIGAITGSLAEAYYGIPDALKKKALSFLPEDMLKIYQEFYISPKCRRTQITCDNIIYANMQCSPNNHYICVLSKQISNDKTLKQIESCSGRATEDQ